ncbi:hypothetical protein FACS189446_1070 [Bacteroidia bacterium]|nr:hypothetical protein FACS189446_1070 [Bacteroidia bacterium]
MTFIQKIKHYYKQAYLTGHFPAIGKIIFTKKIILAYYGFLGDGNVGDELVYDAAKKLFPSCLLIPVTRYKPISLRLYEKRLVKRTKGLIIGGGTLIGDNKIDRYEYLLKTVKKTKLIYIHGTGVKQTINGEWNTIFNQSKIYGGLRGPLSVSVANQYKLNIPAAGDAAFSLFMINNNKAKLYNRILLNFGSHNYYEESKPARNLICKFINDLIQQGYEVFFLPFHSIDLRIGKKLCSRNSHIKLLDIPENFQEIQHLFSSAGYAIGERLHFNIMASLFNCPFFSVNYDGKHTDFLNSLSLTNCGCQMKDLSLEQLTYNFENRNELFDWPGINSQLINYKVLQIKEVDMFLKNMERS